jgi:hypothetical protein
MKHKQCGNSMLSEKATMQQDSQENACTIER